MALSAPLSRLTAAIGSTFGSTLRVGLVGAAAAAVAVGASTAPARAFAFIDVIGTARNLSATSAGSTTDSNWKVASLPTGIDNTSTVASVGTSSFVVYQTPLVGGKCVWFGGGVPTGDPATQCIQTGYSYAGNSYRWVSPSSDAKTLISNATQVNPYSYILEQTITIPSDGTYDFAFSGTADNGVGVFIGGTPTASDTSRTPTITGGTQIGGSTTGLGVLHTYAGSATLTAGSQKVYLVVTDFGQYTGVIISPEVQLVPGPLPLLGAGAAFGWSRRLRRRLERAQQS